RTRGGHGDLEILPLYGRLSEAEQQKIFKPHSSQRVVLATNVAESSLTVPGIVSVIDLGTARISRYSPRSKMQRLPIEPISQASANQRMGRCGRVAPGICIRLYSEKDFLTREPFTPPEIQRTNLAQVILQTVALKLGNIHEFPFLDPPKGGMVRDGYKTLFELGALDEQNQLTEIGRTLARLPVDPRIGRMILAGNDESCLHEILIIASLLEIQDPRDRPVEMQQAADQAHQQFRHEASDFLSILKLWEFYQHIKQELSNSKFKLACKQNFLNGNRLREWSDIHRQLLQLAREAKFPIEKRKPDEDAIHRALLTGLLSNVAMFDDKNEYAGAGGTKRYLWPGSGLAGKKPKWIMSAEVVETSQRFARVVARINPAWIEPLAKHLISLDHSEPHWDPEMGATMAWEKVSLYGMTIVPRRRINYGKIQPEIARELMIRDGLTTGEIHTTGDFLRKNQELIEEIKTVQAKVRRQDYGTLEQQVIEFYDERIPDKCYDAARFEQWRKQAEQTEPGLLELKREQFLEPETKRLDRVAFPDEMILENLRLPLTYQLQPGEDDDGVSIQVTPEQLSMLRQELLDWLVPGLVEEKITALIKSLPKSLRTKLVPAPDTAREVAQKIGFGTGPFLAVVAGELSRIAGELVTVDHFDIESLPDHLRMNIRVVDLAGKLLAKGRVLPLLQREFRAKKTTGAVTVTGKAGPSFADLVRESQFERAKLTSWDCGSLPVSVSLQRDAFVIPAFPALVDRGDHVDLKLFPVAEEAAQKHGAGVRRLLLLAAHSKLQHQLKHFPNLEKIQLLGTTSPVWAKASVQIGELLGRLAFPIPEQPARTEEAFRQQLTAGTNRISIAVQ
ncbi:MAG: ATP-dependent RNA helicase HrpA, partial [Planctomycetaceae bacterium]|nr:ATP-dependent RNA helicase HrpA [Planctomycetaceae bacterium]